MEGQFSRTERLLGAEAVEKLSKAKVIVFGIGGVGGYCVESLVRSGVGQIDVVDDDVVCLSNLNRQIIATRDTVGRAKVEIAEERIHSINPDCKVRAFRCFYLPETKDQFDFSAYDYVVDTVDTVAAKLSLIEAAKEAGVPIISAMGAGNKLNPAGFKVADLYETRICPLAKVMRRECKKRGIEVLLDDRKERTGVKFKDMDLIGIPIRLVVGEKNLPNIEFKLRKAGESSLIDKNKVVDLVEKTVKEELAKLN